MPINSFIENIAKRYALGNATEHTFRGDLQRLIEELVPEVAATNEPKRIECGAPDYVITRRDIPIGYIEAKDIGKDLDARDLKEQFDRYRNALDNLVFTDYLDFRFYINGQLTAKIKIAEISSGRIVPVTANFDQFTSLIKEFCSRTPQTIKSSKRLAEMMAEKAKILAFIIKNALDEDIAAERESDLTNQMKAFKDILIHDIDAKAFADIYAQTIAYGMFAARLHDKDLDTFSRREAAELIPKTNPFLRKLFQYIAGYDLDTRIDWIVDALADLFRATDISAILKNFGKSTQTHDPIMHFYETFLAEYDPKLRKSRGVFYTPEPVVDFIVRAVDDILKTEFNLSDGLADTSKTRVKVEVQGKIQEREVHKVQILDPATGTGTFLATVIKHIYKGFENQQGVWNQYVDEHLIPRLNGFELLMASYAMAHLKLDLLLSELSELQSSGVTESGNSATLQLRNSATRFQIYLTNALEEHHPDTGTLFASWLSTEANEANHIKRDTPVMVVIGNPPYSGVSSNMGKWIVGLIEDYKYVNGEHFGEKKHWLHDDYVKFIRFGQHFVEKNGEGVLAFINNHSFMDNPTFKGMRWNLLKAFDDIYLIDLHGNSKKKEINPDGGVDRNVFDIQAGVSINIFVKTGRKDTVDIASVWHHDMWGSREHKYQLLSEKTIETISFNEIHPQEPYYFFVPKDHSLDLEYGKGFQVAELLPKQAMGITTARDFFVIDHDANALTERVIDFTNKELSTAAFQAKYSLNENYQWKVAEQRQLTPKFDAKYLEKIAYRPFDDRVIYYQDNLVFRARREIMSNLEHPNVALNLVRAGRSLDAHNYFVSKHITDKSLTSSLDNSNTFPLYLYPDDNAQPTLDGRTERVPNLNSEIVDKIAAAIGLTFVAEKETEATGGNASVNERASSNADGTLPNGRVSARSETFAPIDILDYIYAVLHSPSYRDKYKEFLKIDFPRVPYPEDAATFWDLARLGGELRRLHLLESPAVNKFITGFPVGGDNIVEKIVFVSGVSVPGTQAPSPASVRLDADEPGKHSTGKMPGTVTPEEPALQARAPALQSGSVYLNDTQYFSNVPETAWNFYIGGYQPAQKWLKDRKGRVLNYDDIQHYQKIIVALTETGRIMKEIDKTGIV